MSADVEVCPKDRWAWLEVDLHAIRANVRAFKSQLRRSTKFCAVVKANGYGHGAAQVARACKEVGADVFAVATVDEGSALRAAGIEQPIIVLSQPPMDSVERLCAERLEPCAYDLEFVARLGQAAANQGCSAGYHLAIDTGMTRIGIPYDETTAFLSVAERLGGVVLSGVMTHFATADKLVDWGFTNQLRRFEAAVASIRDAGIDPGIVHCANTPATILHPETHMDMVRVGIGLYGLHPAESTYNRIELTPAMSVRGRVTRIVSPATGEGVGYGMTYHVGMQGVQIATVPIGYADGLARGLSGSFDVFCHGRRCHQVGNICMDQFMFEVNPIRPSMSAGPAMPIEVGDVVTVLGRDGSYENTLDMFASKLATINYELACRFDVRLPKVYV